jgi:hypothetical protein
MTELAVEVPAVFRRESGRDMDRASDDVHSRTSGGDW